MVRTEKVPPARIAGQRQAKVSMSWGAAKRLQEQQWDFSGVA